MKTTLRFTAIAATILAAVAFSACPSTCLGDIRIGLTPAGHIAKDRSLPGKGTQGGCMPYAVALHKRLEKAGIPSKVIVYSYTKLKSPVDLQNHDSVQTYSARAGAAGTHAVVAYEDRGRTYITDNMNWMPVWVARDSVSGLAERFSGNEVAVHAARVQQQTECAARRHAKIRRVR